MGRSTNISDSWRIMNRFLKGKFICLELETYRWYKVEVLVGVASMVRAVQF